MQIDNKTQVDYSKLFKIQCKEILQKQPDSYLSNFIKDQNLQFNLGQFKVDDVPFLDIFMLIPFKSILMFQQEQVHSKLKNNNKSKGSSNNMAKMFYESNKFVNFLKIINKNLIEEKLNSLKSLKFLNFPFNIKFIYELASGIEKAKYLKQLSFVKCSLTDDHLQLIKTEIANNVSLTKLDFSDNKLVQCGGIIGKILSEHSNRRETLKYMYSIRNIKPEYDLSNAGICEINLQGNQLNSKSIEDMVTFLKYDAWTKCINLRKNNIGQEGIKSLILMLKNNTTLMSLDLRGNEGLGKHYSKFIIKKLRENIETFKKLQRIVDKKKLPELKNQFSPLKLGSPLKNSKSTFEPFDPKSHNTSLTFNKHNNNKGISENHFNNQSKKSDFLGSTPLSSSKEFQSIKKAESEFPSTLFKPDYTTLESKESHHKICLFPINSASVQSPVKNRSSIPKKQNSQCFEQSVQQCKKCHELTLKTLKAEKANIQLQIQVRKLRHFISKNIDAQTHHKGLTAQNGNISASFHKQGSIDNDDELISRMEVLMCELTKIMETAEFQQNTQITIENAFSHIHSLSKTISIYERPKNLMEVNQQIEEDPNLNLQQFHENSVSQIEKTSEKQENSFQLNKQAFEQ